jgi:hypothetical protein
MAGSQVEIDRVLIERIIQSVYGNNETDDQLSLKVVVEETEQE